MGDTSGFLKTPQSTSTMTNSTSEDEDEDSEDEDSEEWSGVNDKIDQDTVYEKNATLSVNTTVKWKVFAKQNLTLSPWVEVTWDVVVLGNLSMWVNSKIVGNVKVLWTVTMYPNSEVEWNLYWYKTVSTWVNSIINWKIKSAWKFSTAPNFSWEWKLYAFGWRWAWVNFDFSSTLEKWILGKLDAYLLIDISNEDFEVVKKISATYDVEFAKVLAEIKKTKVALQVANWKLKLAKTSEEKASAESEIKALNDKLSSQKETWKDLIEKLIVDTQEYIENQDFDKKWVNVYLKNEELAKLELNQAVAKDVISKVEEKSQKIENKQEVKQEVKQEINLDDKPTSNTKQTVWTVKNNEKLKNSIRAMLDKKLSNLDEAKKSKILETLAWKLDNVIENAKSEKAKNTLVILKEVVLEMQDEWSAWDEIDNLFKDLNSTENSSQNK